MKTNRSPRLSRGYALLLALFLTSACIVILASTMGRTADTQLLNNRNNRMTASLYAAEAATEKVLARMKYDYLIGSLTYVTNNLSIYQSYVPTASESPYWGTFQFDDGQGHVGKTYVQCLSSLVYTSLASQYVGLNGWRTQYRVLSNAIQTNGDIGVRAAVQQDIEFDSLPVFQFAIFYNSLLEFTWAATLTVNGRTHANGNIFVGSSCPLTFNSLVTTTGGIYKTNWDGYTVSQYTGTITYNGGYSTNCQVLQLPIGTNNTPAAVREILNIPPSGESPSSAMGQQRFYNKATITLLVSNTTVSLNLKTSTNDLAKTNIVASYWMTNIYSTTNFYSNPSNYYYSTIAGIYTNFPFLSLTNGSTNMPKMLTFRDQRENKTVWVTQIDMGKLSRWIATNSWITNKFFYNSGFYPNVLYVADFRTQNATNLPAIRLMNASIIPTNMAPSGQATGFTVATPNPLYVWGNYNCPDSGALGKTDTSKTFPASLVSDALTILSANWSDSLSTNTLSSRNPACSTTVNAAILTGIVFSTGSGSTQFSGGVMNLPRLLEDWGNSGSVTLTLNSSIVNFYNSIYATNQFVNPGTYYYAPTRQFSFDPNFTNYAKLPPGTPMLGATYRAKWAQPPPNVTTYAGN